MGEQYIGCSSRGKGHLIDQRKGSPKATVLCPLFYLCHTPRHISTCAGVFFKGRFTHIFILYLPMNVSGCVQM